MSIAASIVRPIASSIASSVSGAGDGSVLQTVDFDGVNGYVTGTPQNVFNTSASFTIAMTIDTDTVGSAWLVSMNSADLLVSFNGSDFAWGTGTGWSNFPHSGSDGDWRFVYDFTLSGFARWRAFRNGSEVTAGSTTGTFAAPSPPNGPLRFGARTTGINFFDGRLSGIKIWSRVCTPGDSDQASNLTLSLQTITGSTWNDTSSNNTDYTLTGGATAV
jgi:hypothetical protein